MEQGAIKADEVFKAGDRVIVQCSWQINRRGIIDHFTRNGGACVYSEDTGDFIGTYNLASSLALDVGAQQKKGPLERSDIAGSW